MYREWVRDCRRNIGICESTGYTLPHFFWWKGTLVYVPKSLEDLRCEFGFPTLSKLAYVLGKHILVVHWHGSRSIFPSMEDQNSVPEERYVSYGCRWVCLRVEKGFWTVKKWKRGSRNVKDATQMCTVLLLPEMRCREFRLPI